MSDQLIVYVTSEEHGYLGFDLVDLRERVMDQRGHGEHSPEVVHTVYTLIMDHIHAGMVTWHEDGTWVLPRIIFDRVLREVE